jgi:TetR/AcrR family transcriptional regulator
MQKRSKARSNKADSIRPKTREKSFSEDTAGVAPKLRKRRPKEVKARILDASLKAFARDGFKGARMRAIAQDAGITIQLLIHHAKTKDNLWKMTLEHVMAQSDSFRHSHDTQTNHPSAAQRLRALITDIVRFNAKVPELYRLMTKESTHITPRLVWLTDTYTRKLFDEGCALIVACQKEGTVPKVDPVRLRYALISMSSLLFSVSAEYEYLTGKNPFSESEIERTIEFICDMAFIK